MIRIASCTATAASLFSSVASAHGGHAVPPGVPPAHHLHLTEHLVIGPLGLLALLLAVGAGAAVWLLRRRARAGKAGREGGRGAGRR